MQKIILSVGIASYNRKEWLCKNINNLLSYKRDDVEFIVCDNASDDGTWEALQHYTDQRLRLVRNTINCGAMYNWFKACVLGVGKYGVFINDRDTLDINALYEFVDCLRDHEWDVVTATSRFLYYRNKVDNIAIRAWQYNRCEHPGIHFFSRNIINKIKYKLEIDPERMTETELNKWEAELRYEWELDCIHADKWYWYDKGVVRVTDRGKEGIKATRKESVPWYYPEGGIERVKNYFQYAGNDTDLEEIICGVYRAGLQICLAVYYVEGNTEGSSKGKIASDFKQKAIAEAKNYSKYNTRFRWKISQITFLELIMSKIETIWREIVVIKHKVKIILQPIIIKKK